MHGAAATQADLIRHGAPNNFVPERRLLRLIH